MKHTQHRLTDAKRKRRKIRRFRNHPDIGTGSVAAIYVVRPPVWIGLALLAILAAGLAALLLTGLLPLLALTLLILTTLLAAALLRLAGTLLLAALHVLIAALLLITLVLVLAWFVLLVCHRGVSWLGKAPST